MIQTPYKWCIPCLPSWATDLKNLVSLKHHCKEWRFAIAFTWKCLGRVVVQINQPYLKMPKWYLFRTGNIYWPLAATRFLCAYCDSRWVYFIKFTKSADCRAHNEPSFVTDTSCLSLTNTLVCDVWVYKCLCVYVFEHNPLSKLNLEWVKFITIRLHSRWERTRYDKMRLCAFVCAYVLCLRVCAFDERRACIE